MRILDDGGCLHQMSIGHSKLQVDLGRLRSVWGKSAEHIAGSVMAKIVFASLIGDPRNPEVTNQYSGRGLATLFVRCSSRLPNGTVGSGNT